MDDLPLSRRQFVTGAGTLAAASVFAPQALAARLTGLRAPTLRGGRFAEGVISGDPTPNGITLWTPARRGRRKRERASSRSPRTRGSGASWLAS